MSNSTVNSPIVATFYTGGGVLWGRATIILSSILGTIALLVVCVRFYVRAIILRRIDLSDWVMVITLGLAIWTVFDCCQAAAALDPTSSNEQVALPVFVVHAFYRTQTAYLFVTTLIKVSILCFYLRIADSRIERSFRIIVYTVLCAVITFCIGIFIGIIVGCTPFEAYWLAFDPVWRTTHRFHCSSSPKALFVAVSIVPCPLDFLVAFIPILLVRKLTIPLGQKVALVSLFAVAFCASLGAVVRSVYLFRVIVQQGSFRTASQIYFWTNVEICLSIICSSAPALRAFAMHFKKRKAALGPRGNAEPHRVEASKEDPGCAVVPLPEQSQLSHASTIQRQSFTYFGYCSRATNEQWRPTFPTESFDFNNTQMLTTTRSVAERQPSSCSSRRCSSAVAGDGRPNFLRMASWQGRSMWWIDRSVENSHVRGCRSARGSRSGRFESSNTTLIEESEKDEGDDDGDNVVHVRQEVSVDYEAKDDSGV